MCLPVRLPDTVRSSSVVWLGRRPILIGVLITLEFIVTPLEKFIEKIFQEIV
jgi:hypothetical protein